MLPKKKAEMSKILEKYEKLCYLNMQNYEQKKKKKKRNDRYTQQKKKKSDTDSSNQNNDF